MSRIDQTDASCIATKASTRGTCNANGSEEGIIGPSLTKACCKCFRNSAEAPIQSIADSVGDHREQNVISCHV